MKSFNQFAPFLILIAFLSLGSSISAQNIAHVNAEEIIQEMPEYKQAKANLEAFSKVLQKQLEAQRTKMEDHYTSVMDSVQRGLLTPIQQRAAEQRLAKMQQDLQNAAVQADQQLVEKEVEVTKPVYDKFNSALENVAKSNGYAYIIDRKIALYSNGGTDVGNLVKQELGM